MPFRITHTHIMTNLFTKKWYRNDEKDEDTSIDNNLAVPNENKKNKGWGWKWKGNKKDRGQENFEESRKEEEGDLKGLEAVYGYASKNFQEGGFDDALSNPDISNMNDSLKILEHNLIILIQKELKGYRDQMQILDANISSLESLGLIDAVSYKEKEKVQIESSIIELEQIKEEATEKKGLIERVNLSYKKGFSRGVIAITNQKNN